MATEIKVESANATPIPSVQEWFIPLMDMDGTGDWWSAGLLSRTQLDAEGQIRNNSTEVKQGRIVRVVLPCKKIE